MDKWPADSIERKPIADLIPYARNSRTHSDEQVAQIAASIKEWGFTTPILADEKGMIIAGHGRVMAAHRLGIKELPVMTATKWTDAQKQAYIIADNKLTLNAGWDDDILKIELGELEDLDFDLSLVGFDEDELENILNGNEKLSEKEEKINKITMTYILIGIPTSVDPEFLKDSIIEIKNRGGRVDYAGNSKN